MLAETLIVVLQQKLVVVTLAWLRVVAGVGFGYFEVAD